MGTVQDTLPDICIAYKLHLECGRLINLYDWLQVWSTLFVVLFKWLFPFSLLLFLLPVINSFSFYQYRTSRMLVLELLIFCMHNGKLAAHSHTLLVSATDSKNVIMPWQTSLCHSLQHIFHDFFKRKKFEVNLMHVMNFESVELFFAIYLQLLYLAGKRQTQQNCKQTVRHLPQWLEKSCQISGWNQWCVQRPEKNSHFNMCMSEINSILPLSKEKMGGSDFWARGIWKWLEITCNRFFSNLPTVVTCLCYLTIRPVAQKGYGSIAHEVKPNGLLTHGPWGRRV